MVIHSRQFNVKYHSNNINVRLNEFINTVMNKNLYNMIIFLSTLFWNIKNNLTFILICTTPKFFIQTVFLKQIP